MWKVLEKALGVAAAQGFMKPSLAMIWCQIGCRIGRVLWSAFQRWCHICATLVPYCMPHCCHIGGPGVVEGAALLDGAWALSYRVGRGIAHVSGTGTGHCEQLVHGWVWVPWRIRSASGHPMCMSNLDHRITLAVWVVWGPAVRQQQRPRRWHEGSPKLSKGHICSDTPSASIRLHALRSEMLPLRCGGGGGRLPGACVRKSSVQR